MSIDFDKIWSGSIHREFIDALAPGRVFALWQLLLVATFADDELTIDERREVADALANAEGFDARIDLESVALTGNLEDLYSRFESDPGALIEEIGDRLGDDSTRRHAFRTVVQLMRTDEFVDEEEEFTRLLGERLGLEPEVVEFAIADARGD